MPQISSKATFLRNAAKAHQKSASNFDRRSNIAQPLGGSSCCWQTPSRILRLHGSDIVSTFALVQFNHSYLLLTASLDCRPQAIHGLHHYLFRRLLLLPMLMQPVRVYVSSAWCIYILRSYERPRLCRDLAYVLKISGTRYH